MPAAPTDFRLYHGNDLEILAGVLAQELARPVPGGRLLDPDTILIPQPAMRRWLQKTLAQTHGIAANLRFLTPGEFVRQALDANVPGAGDAAVGDAATLRWRLWAVLADPAILREPVFEPLHAVLGGDDHELAAWTLAGELAAAFEKYQAWRRDWLRRWDHGGDRDDWQAQLWRRATRGLSHRGRRLDDYLSRLDGDAALIPSGLPARVFAFACQNVSPDVLRVIASAARAGSLHFFFLSPVAHWWGDLRSARERLRDGPEAVFEDDENPLLRANGQASRDFVRTLFSYEIVHPSWEQAIYEPPDPRMRRGLLHRLQRDLLDRRPLPDAHDTALPWFDAAARSDRSLQIHACHTRLREVQVLHDQLRALLEADPQLQPREIAVLTPDIDVYAPHIHAVFGGAPEVDGENAARKIPLSIPYAITDSSTLAALPMVEAFLRVLALPSARFTANEVIDLLAVPAVAQRFGLEAADFSVLRHWLREAGARWGLNASHRAALDAPAENAYTWAWALDRLLLGYARGDDHDVAGVAPWPQLEGSAISTLDAMLQGLRALARAQRALGGTHDAQEWQARLSQVLEDLFPARPIDTADARALETLRAQIDGFARQTATAGLQQTLPASVLRAWFQAALGQDDARQPFLTGGVTFGRMVPMRLIPFKVICLLGMNDGQYPRRDPLGSLNRLSAQLGTNERRIGDRSIRDDDRALFLQLFAAATDVFYLSYLGQDPRSGELQPPSVVVAELIDVAARYFLKPTDDDAPRDAQDAREQLVVRHPLQPFAAEAFGRGDARRFSYHARWRPAAQASGDERRPIPPFVHGPLPRVELAGQRIVSRDRLYQTLAHPAKNFLRQRLGLRLSEPGERLSDAEPFDRDDHLREHALTQRVFAALIADARIDRGALCQRLLAEGRIAPGAAGAEEVTDILATLSTHASTWRGWAQGTARSQSFELALGEFTLTGSLDNIHDTGLLQFRAGKAHGRTQLALGIDVLIWSALGRTQPVHRLVAKQGAQLISPLPQDAARAALLELLRLHEQAREQLLPFMPKTGFAYASALASGKSEFSAWAKAHGEWIKREGYGEGQDPWVRLALRGNDPFDDDHRDGETAQQFRDLSQHVFAVIPGAGQAAENDDD